MTSPLSSRYVALCQLADAARHANNPTEAAALAAEAHAMALDHRDEQEAMIPHSPIGQGDARRAVSVGELVGEVVL